MTPVPLIVLVGPTASGKTRLAVQLAQQLGSGVVSADAFAMYQGMDIGTAKPTLQERAGVPHACIDMIPPEDRSDGARWLGWAETAILDLHAANKVPVVAGGTPLYVKFLLEGMSAGAPRDETLRRNLDALYDQLGPQAFHAEVAAVDPLYAAQRHPNDRRRLVRALEVHRLTGTPYSAFHTTTGGSDPRWRPLILGLVWDRQELYRRINDRTRTLFANGLVEEVRGLQHRLSPEARQAVGYKEVLKHLDGTWDLATTVGQVAQGSRRLAKHQMTFYRGFPDIRWLDGSSESILSNAMQAVTEHLRH